MSRRRLRDGDEIRKRGECSTHAFRKQEEHSFRISRFAKVTTLATEQSQDASLAKSTLEKVDSNLLKRIQKMLKLAQHPNTSEAEAKQAIRASTRMLSAYNLTEADVMAHESTSEQLQRAGHSNVTVRHREGKAVSLESWSLTLGHAICVAFNVKYFYTRYRTHEKIEFTFYGLRDNTVTAALSFEAIFNLALTWALQRQDVRGRSGKNSYLVGLSDSLYRIAKDEKKEEERQAIECETKAIEETERRAKDQESIQKARLANPQLSKSTTIADDDDEEDAEIVFISFKPGRGNGGGPVSVKVEEEKNTGDLQQDMIDDDDEEAGFLDGWHKQEDDIEAMDEEDVEDALGDADTERDRFDRAYDAQRRDVLGERSTNDLVKQELADDVKPDLKPRVAAKAEIKEELADAKPKKEEDETDTEIPTWQTHAQLTIFKETASKLAEEYLKTLTTKIKTKKTRARTSPYDKEAYRKGVEDAKNVDMKRRRLE